jgi:SAM-dependent methyltransferase
VEQSGESVQQFFDDYYSGYAAQPEHQRWRATLATRNANEIIPLLAKGGRRSDRIVELGFGDGALLAELSARGVGRRYVAYEVSRSAVNYLRSRPTPIPGLDKIDVYDGFRTPERDGAFDVAIVSHVIEHASAPEAVLREASRLAPTVAVQIILADTLPARRAAHHRAVERTGHFNEYNLSSARAAIEAAGLCILADAISHPDRRLRTYWNRSPRAQALAMIATGAFAVAPPIARRLFAADYTAVCALAAA